MAVRESNGALTGLAFTNLSQNQDTYRATIRDEIFGGYLFCCLAAVAFWMQYSDDVNSLIPNIPWLDVATGTISALLLVTCLLLIKVKVAAAFLVDSASLVTLTGAIKIVQPESKGRYPKVQLQARTFFLETSKRFSVEDEDVLAVTGARTSEGFRPLAYRNVTRSLTGKSSAVTGYISSIIYRLVLSAVFAKAVFDAFFDPSAIFFFAIGTGFLVMIQTSQIDNYYRWRFDHEIRHRMAVACASLAK